MEKTSKISATIQPEKKDNKEDLNNNKFFEKYLQYFPMLDFSEDSKNYHKGLYNYLN